MLTNAQMVNNHQLNTQQLNDLEHLGNRCKMSDGNYLNVYPHILIQNRPMPCNVLYYQEERLIGFLSAFFFYEDTTELVVMVDPSFRKRGVATQLIHQIMPLLLLQKIKHLVFPAPHNLNDTWLTAKHFVHQNSEYQMQYKGNQPIALRINNLTVRDATEVDVPVLCNMDNACFPSSAHDMSKRFYMLLNDPHYKIFILLNKGIPIGKAHVYHPTDEARLTDIAVLPHHQGQGFGGYLLAHCVNHCLAAEQHLISLDVETTNQHALKLYKRLGFDVINAYDFWSIPIELFLN